MDEFLNIFFSRSPKMKRVKSVVDEIAGTDITVLVRGESGTGKGVVAQAIHRRSPRKGKPFITVNCGAIPHTLLESELFGFEKGAFTGAHIKKPGKFELANGGTILLNDIGDIDVSIQAKLLQVLQDGAFSRLGGEGDILVDARIVATTNEDLEKSMSEGRFREDLYFRINMVTITLPPLRERREQILPLSEYFLDVYQKRYSKPLASPLPVIKPLLEDYSWPGNIRELENMIKRVVLFGKDEVIKELQSGVAGLAASGSGGNAPGLDIPDLRQIARQAAESAEKEVIRQKLHETLWNRKQTAKLLGISYKALLYKIERYELNGAKRRPANNLDLP